MRSNINRNLILLITSMTMLTLTIIVGCTTPTPTRIYIPSTTISNEQPVDVLSVIGPLSPINPGGPIVEITLKNVSSDPVTSLFATLQLNRAFNFNFDVTSSNPLLPDKSISARLTLITGGFSDNIAYSLAITGTLQDGEIFGYTRQVQIVMPSK